MSPENNRYEKKQTGISWRIGLLCCLSVLITTITKGQTDVNISHRYQGRLNFNPAAAGEDPSAIVLKAYFREQWMGFDRAPSTQVINVDNYFNKYNSGAGLIFIKDEIGFSKSLNLKFAYAYHLKLNQKSWIYLGLALGMIHNSSDERNFNPEDPNDPSISYLLEKETIADFDVGVEYHWTDLTLGLSASHITKGKNDAKITPHYYGYAHYGMNINEDWRLTPSVFVAINNKVRIYEIGAITEYRSKISAGLVYRLSESFYSDAFVGLLGITLSEYVSLGYSYDFTVGQSASDITGAHELMLSFRMKK